MENNNVEARKAEIVSCGKQKSVAENRHLLVRKIKILRCGKQESAGAESKKVHLVED